MTIGHSGPRIHRKGDVTGRELWAIVREASVESMTDNIPTLGAALAFYATFSLAPLLVVVVAMAGFIYGADAASGRLMDEMRSFVGEDGGRALQAMIAASGQSGTGIWASLVGGLALLIGATGLFSQLQQALNAICDVEPAPIHGWWNVIRSRLLSFSLVLGCAFLLLVSLIASATLAAFAGRFGDSWSGVIGQWINVVVSFVVITGLFAMIYRYLPDAVIAWKDIWLGAVITSLLFGIGKHLFGLYLGHAALTSVYGAAASLVVLLLWNYYAAQIVLFGAELTKSYARRLGSGIVPAPHAHAIGAGA